MSRDQLRGGDNLHVGAVSHHRLDSLYTSNEPDYE